MAESEMVYSSSLMDCFDWFGFAMRSNLTVDGHGL
jgi:hypothetical protein